jgi:predicted transposase/invertase (TIGR01784 family)
MGFHGDCEFTEFILNAICPHAGFKVTQVRTQQMLSNVMGRSLKLDILADDALGRKVNIEVQNLASGAAPVRARFHSSLLDAHLLEKGQNFADLPTTYIIFITKTDVLGDGLPIYTVDRQICESGKTFDDKEIILYVNGVCMNDTLLGRIMHDFQCNSPDEMKCQTVANKVQNIKETKEEKKMGALYDFFYEEFYDEIHDEIMKKGRAQGRKEGLEKGLEKVAQMIGKHIYKSKCTVDEALEWFEVSQEDVPKVRALVYAEFEKQKKTELLCRESNIEKLKTQALMIAQYVDKTECTVQEALDFFQIPESDHKLMIEFVNRALKLG